MSDSIAAFVDLRGTFYRAIDLAFRDSAISGSRAAGRYSRPDERTLYLSSSVDGVEAAMIAHQGEGSVPREVVSVEVDASHIVDFRDASVLAILGIALTDATAPWQGVVARGGIPSSWVVRDRLVQAGAHGLIDPSRKRPGLWHLVLFRWNEANAPVVRVVS